MNRKTLFNRMLSLSAVFLAILLFSGCKGVTLENKTEQIEEYTKAQAMIILANERNRYQNAYSPDIWSIRIEEKDETFDRVLTENVKEYLQKIKLLCMLAEERSVQANSRERDLIRQMTDDYMDSLSEADIAFIGCGREDVQKMYTDYFTACKMADMLVSGSSVDISDSEVKVIRIMQIGTQDLKKAKAILKKVKIDGSDFNSMASRYSELGQIETELKKGTKSDLIERTAFSLDEGEISNILCIDGMYYIVKVVNGYDREETDSRKTGLKTAVSTLRFQEVLEPYAKEHNIVFFDSFWNDVNLRTENGSTADGFFDIYELYKD